METTSRFKTRIVSGVNEIPADIWNSCAFEILDPTTSFFPDPFISHEFFQALEASGSASIESGWAPQHIVLEDYQQNTVGIAPMYLKSHSYGEYVFDWAWADAFERAGGAYYPKLQGAVPFTPVSGRRLLIKEGPQSSDIFKALINASQELAKHHNVSSIHFTFPDLKQAQLLWQNGMLSRSDRQFHWENQGYQSFEDFLKVLSSKKRRNIQKERKQVKDNELVIEHVTGSAIKEYHWDHFFQFYSDTGNRKWGIPYLTRPFFSLLGEKLKNQIWLIFSKQGGRYVAGALNLFSENRICGRYWGCSDYRPFLHFELCYYQAIDFAIANNIRWVEAGAQGEHKLSRGYLPKKTYSAHWFQNPQLHQAIEKYLKSELHYLDEEIIDLTRHSPFKPSKPK